MDDRGEAMTLMTAQVIDEIVAIKVCNTLAVGGTTRGEGVAFWCNVNGVCKLVTAAHLAWPPPMRKPQNEVLYVQWATTTRTGRGEAIFTPHTPGGYPDFADILFLDQSNNPPRGLVFPCGQMPKCGDQVACVGFPGGFVVSPLAARIDGIVDVVTQGSLSVEAMVDGAGACGGYSGGPVFFVESDGNLDDRVAGLMSGAPPLPGTQPDANGNIPHDTNKWVFFSALSFK